MVLFAFLLVLSFWHTTSIHTRSSEYEYVRTYGKGGGFLVLAVFFFFLNGEKINQVEESYVCTYRILVKNQT